MISDIPAKSVVSIPAGYYALGMVLQQAVDRTAVGKGTRHQDHADQPFVEQDICTLPHGFRLGQLIKKTKEVLHLPKRVHQRDELLDVIVYAAAEIIVLEREMAEEAKRREGKRSAAVKEPPKSGNLL